MDRKSTSFHVLNSDLNKPSSIFYKLKWITANWLNNRCPMKNVDERIKLVDINPKKEDIEKYWEMLSRSTPTRNLNDLFWINLPWNDISEILGNIKIADVGCGSGLYVERLKKFQSNEFEYHGFDVFEADDWKRLQSDKIGFTKIKDVKDISFDDLFANGTNLIISISALEHIENELELFANISEAVKKTDKPVFQIHMIPSAECLPLYGLHGIREYTPRTMSHITRLFDDNTKVTIFDIRANDSYELFRKTSLKYRYLYKTGQISKDEDLKEFLNRDGGTGVKEALLADAAKKNNKYSIHYALVLEHNVKERVIGK